MCSVLGDGASVLLSVYTLQRHLCFFSLACCVAYAIVCIRFCARAIACVARVNAVEGSELIFVFVDTPSGSADRWYDHSKLSRVLCGLAALRIENRHVIIGCTVTPGYTGTHCNVL